jgi:ankyrin repeat protein
LLIAKGAKIDDPTEDRGRETPLHYAARCDRLDVAKVLVEHKANINAKNDTGLTPLHDACRTGDLALVALLLEHGANVRAADRDGTTPAMCAAGGWGWKNQYVAILQLLAKHGASLTTRTASGECLLHRAAESHLVETAKFLIETGLDVNARTENGVTPLHCAAQGYATSDIDMVKLLLEHGANVNAVALANVEESTPSQTAYVTKKITPLGYAMSVKHFAPIQTDIPGVYEKAEENVKQINRTRKTIADLLRRHGAK